MKKNSERHFIYLKGKRNVKKAIKSKRLRAGVTTYLDVFDKPKPMEGDQELLNHQRSVGLLVDPESAMESFNTHEGKYDVKASAKKKSLLADLLEDSEPELVGDEDPVVDEEIPVEEPASAVEEEKPVESADENLDPAVGDEVEENHLDDLTDEEIEANEDAADNASDVLTDQDLSLEEDTELDEEPAAVEEACDKIGAKAKKGVKAEAEPEEPFVNPPAEQAGEVTAPAETEVVNNPAQNAPLAVESDELDLVDIDGMDDTMTDDVDFVDMGEDVVAVKANRIIATLTRNEAARKGILASYKQDHFERAVRLEMQKSGLRAGLKACGFTLASVKMPAAKQITLQIAAAQKKMTAAAQAQAKSEKEIRLQATAIACEGLNRGLFKGYKNELRASLIENLEQAGLRNAKRVVARAFAEQGVAYLKSVLALAEKIQAMPEEVRDGYAEQLDMTEEPIDEEAAACRAEDMMGEECEECMEGDEPLMAAVAKPIRQLTASAQHNDVLAMLKETGSDNAFFRTF